jgi:hypothetical protein
MFHCQATKTLSKPGEPSRKLVTHIRPVTYRKGDEIIGEGHEIAREINVSAEYYNEAIARGHQPEVLQRVDRAIKHDVKRAKRPDYND